MTYTNNALYDAKEKVRKAQKALDEAWHLYREEQELSFEKMLFEGPGLMGTQIAWSNSWTSAYVDWLKAKLELANVEMQLWTSAEDASRG